LASNPGEKGGGNIRTLTYKKS